MISKHKLKSLYRKGLSMQEIANEMGVSNHHIVYRMNKYEITRRSRSAANYIKYNPDGDPFKIKRLKTKRDLELFNLGVGLYLGEGAKKNKFNTVFTNSNPQIIKLFLRFLREICRVKEVKIRAALNVFDDVNLKEVINFWIKTTEIPISRFGKAMVRKSRGGTYKNKSPYGTLAIYFPNVKLKALMDKWCQNILDKYSQVPK